jgi:hypothetical protein
MDADLIKTTQSIPNPNNGTTKNIDRTEVFELFDKLNVQSPLNLFPAKKDAYGRFVRTSRYDYSQVGESSSRSS